MSPNENIKELLKNMLSIKKEMQILENSIKGATKLKDLNYEETDFEDLILEELNEAELESQTAQIYQEPISGETYGIGPWQ
ncbi:hypothetical protein [Paraclostridium dentum]|uniref:hypothetical protein n=1 Tax=Paraclostridium dentum TaxID=2662455 RepID=UPI0014732A62|nr:hypothetical protein [Paraclostridium dentum]